MFSLEQSIRAWRRQMTTGGIGPSEVLNELESHLRDEIERRMQSGEPAEHAYEAAWGEARRLGHEFIGTEHVLLGLMGLAKGPVANVMRRLNLDPEKARAEVERLISSVTARTAAAGIPLAPRARKAVRLAAREAKALKHPGLDAEHRLLGLLLEGSGVAAQALKNLGIQSENAREAILSELRARSTC